MKYKENPNVMSLLMIHLPCSVFGRNISGIQAFKNFHNNIHIVDKSGTS